MQPVLPESGEQWFLHVTDIGGFFTPETSQWWPRVKTHYLPPPVFVLPPSCCGSIFLPSPWAVIRLGNASSKAEAEMKQPLGMGVLGHACSWHHPHRTPCVAARWIDPGTKNFGRGKGAIYQYLKKCTGAREGFTWAHGTSERTEGSAVSLLQNSCTVAKIEKINIEILQDMVYNNVSF